LGGPLFELTRKDVAFVWDVGCEQAYQALKAALVDAHVLTRANFKQTFWLDVDWSPKGVGVATIKKMLSELPIKFGLRSLSYRFQRCNCGWNSGELLLIHRLLLESPFSFLVSPCSLANEAGSRATMLHPK
jgi:hypothetical protein